MKKKHKFIFEQFLPFLKTQVRQILREKKKLRTLDRRKFIFASRKRWKIVKFFLITLVLIQIIFVLVIFSALTKSPFKLSLPWQNPKEVIDQILPKEYNK